MSYRYLLLALALLIPARTAFAGYAVLGESCDLKEVFHAEDTKDYLTFDAALRDALRSNDPTALAVLVKYPLNVDTPKGGSFSINDARTLQLRYDEIVSKTVRNAVLGQGPEKLWCRDDWAQYEQDNVTVQIRQVDVGSSKEFRVTDIDFLSPEAEEVPMSTRKIDFICHNHKYRIVVDAANDNNETSLRYRAWINPHSPTEKPDMMILGGTNESGGSGECAQGSWSFKNGKTQYTVSELGCSDGSEPKGSIGSVEISVGDKPVETLWCYP